MNNDLKDTIQTIFKEVLEPIQKDIESIKSGQSELNQLLRAVHDRQEETDAKLEALSMDLNKLHGVVTDHREKINSIAESQERIERILETLALRSIEQETVLRDLKRII